MTTSDAYIYGMVKAGDRYAHILGAPDLALCGKTIRLQPLDDTEAEKRLCPTCVIYAKAARQTRHPRDHAQTMALEDRESYPPTSGEGEASPAAPQLHRPRANHRRAEKEAP